MSQSKNLYALLSKVAKLLPLKPIYQETELEAVKPPIDGDDYWMDRDGNKIKPGNIKPYERLRESTVREVAAEWKALHRKIAWLKRHGFDAVQMLLDTCAADYGVTLAGVKKGSCSLPTYDGSQMLQRTYKDRMKFDERINAAEELIREYLGEKKEALDDDTSAIIGIAFERNKEGELNRSMLIKLRSLNIADERWKKAMTIIAEAEVIVDAACYLMLHEADPTTGKWLPVPLDIAAIKPHDYSFLERLGPVELELFKLLERSSKLLQMAVIESLNKPAQPQDIPVNSYRELIEDIKPWLEKLNADDEEQSQ